MYLKYFGLAERPFSIAPDPNYLYMSARHKEAMAHLSYGLSQGGCFIVLTGEVGTGKTTLCRNLLSDLPNSVDVALILNANIDETELLQTVCDELKISYRTSDSQKQLLDQINSHLMATFAENRHTVLIIDEAQLLSRDVLEKIRLLTNLETTKSKLLQIILIGQPELNDLLSRNDLRQLAQRVTARYHLGALERSETDDYINFRLGVAGCKQPLFSRQALNKLHSLTGGIPRRMNVLADHSLLSAYSKTQSMVDSSCVKKSAQEVFIQSEKSTNDTFGRYKWWGLAATVLLLNIGLSWFFLGGESTGAVTAPKIPVVQKTADQSPAEVAGLTQSDADRPESGKREPGKREPGKPESGKPESGKPELGNSHVDFADVVADESSVNPGDGTSDAFKDEPEANAPSDTDAQLSGILASDEVSPGTVVISGEYLDEDIPPQTQTIAMADVEPTLVAPIVTASRKPQYDRNSEFGVVLDTSADVTGRIAVFRNLSAAWDADLPEKLIKPACLELSSLAVQCSSAKSWRQVLRFNRPSILVLEQGNQLHRVIVFKVDEERARVLVGDTEHTVSVDELEGRWTRSAVTFWRPGDVGTRVLRLGESFDKMPAVREHMNKALAAANLPALTDLKSTEYDGQFFERTKALQARFGLLVDGQVGNETYLLMNELVLPDATPVLTQRIP